MNITNSTDETTFSDFDGTGGNTFSKSPKGLDVHEAYNLAVRNVLGKEALDIYIGTGGLQNRTPVQVVRQLLGDNTKSQSYIACVEKAKRYYEEHYAMLENLVPKDKGGIIDFEKDVEGSITELLVRSKLSYLMNEVGGQLPNKGVWPELFPGFGEFITIYPCGIISSGHELFVRKTFEVHNLECPSVIISDDTLRGLSHLSFEQRSKPHPKLMELALAEAGVTKARAYIGDDPVKDGQLAENSGIPFWWFMSDLAPKVYKSLPKDTLVFTNWYSLIDTLRK